MRDLPDTPPHGDAAPMLKQNCVARASLNPYSTQPFRPPYRGHVAYSGVSILANTKQSKKRARQSVAHREHNAALRSMVRSYIKKVAKLTAEGKKQEAEAAYKEAVPVIDRIADKGLIHRNKASRHKSRLNQHIRALKS
jgi:small subunit ribosomal protein S20